MITVRDIMNADVVTIRHDESARSLARLLADSDISGVPVVDGNDRVVGVASTTDLVRLAAGDVDVLFANASVGSQVERGPDIEDDELEEALVADAYGFFLPEDAPLSSAALFEQLPESAFDRASVAEVMTEASFAVGPDLEIPDLCDYLHRGRIHRALVVEDGALLGIVTSQDVLRAVADQRVPV